MEGKALAAIILGIAAWVSFVTALITGQGLAFFLLVAFAAGGVALWLAFSMRKEGAHAAAAAGAAGGAAAGLGLLYGAALATMLTALLYATGVLVALIVLFFIFLLGWQPAYYTAPSQTCTCDPCSGCSCCCSGSSSPSFGCGNGTSGGGSGGCCCGGSSSSSSSGGGCCGGGGSSGSSSSGGCCGGSSSSSSGGSSSGGGGKCCGAPAFLARDHAHHPDTPEFRADVYAVRGARYCIGCFTTFPVLVLATLMLAFRAPAWSSALAWGALLAGAQIVSSAGLARWRWSKVLVKASLGLGLALVVAGVRAAPWSVVAKLLALVALVALAWASTIPRARRMRAASCSCEANRVSREA